MNRRAFVTGLGAVLAASRVYAGLHYPTDVVGGWAIGVGLGLIVRQREVACGQAA